MDQYIGTAKLVDNVLENGLVHYTLDNGLSLTATQDQFISMVSSSAYDDGQVSMRKWKPLIEQIIQLIMDNNAEFLDVGWILDRINETVIQNANAATAKMFGVTSRDKVTLKKFDEVLKSS